MGNQQCCQNLGNLVGEQGKTSFPFAKVGKTVSEQSKSGSESIISKIRVDKENSRPPRESLKSLTSRDSQIVDAMYKAIESNVIDQATKPLVIFGRKDLGDVLSQFEVTAANVRKGMRADWKIVSEPAKLSLEVETAAKFYRSKAQKEYPKVTFGGSFTEHYRSKDGVSVSGKSIADGMDGRGRVVFGSKVFYEGQISGNLPNGIGLMFYSMSVIYYGSFSQGRRNGKGVLEQRSVKV